MLQDYYDQRADEYEAIYHRNDPVRQREQVELATALKAVMAGRRVLEVACGTGYWTREASTVVTNLTAVDASHKMLAIARRKELSPERVCFREGNAFELSSVLGDFDAGLACFWLSHVPKARIAQFLDGFHRRLGVGAAVFMADSMFMPGVGGELVARQGEEDTYKVRVLADGSMREILKNYYDADQLHSVFAARSSNLSVTVRSCFWWISYNALL